jgi:hypothetical protein
MDVHFPATDYKPGLIPLNEAYGDKNSERILIYLPYQGFVRTSLGRESRYENVYLLDGTSFNPVFLSGICRYE